MGFWSSLLKNSRSVQPQERQAKALVEPYCTHHRPCEGQEAH